MLTSGRKRGGKAGTGVGARTVRLTLGGSRPRSKWPSNDGHLVRNVVRLVASPEYTPEERPGSTPSGTPTSSADCSSGASSARSGCTTPGTPPFPQLEKAGVPISIVSKWAGHYDAAFTMTTYVHASHEDLKQGTETLALIHKIA
jgi:hypothetical protein